MQISNPHLIVLLNLNFFINILIQIHFSELRLQLHKANNELEGMRKVIIEE